MRFRSFSVMVASFVALVSCSGGVREREADPMLRTVPSDAVALAAYSRADKMITTLTPEDDLLRKLNLGRLGGRRAALSYCYARTLTAILAIDAGKNASDSLSRFREVMHEADSLGLHPLLAEAPFIGGHVLLLSCSQTLIDETERHIGTGSSIYDADGFDAAVEAVSGRDVVFLRNSSAQRWLPATFSSFDRRQSVTMLRKLTEWTVLSDCGRGRFDIAFSQGEDAPFYSTVLKSVAEEPVRVCEAVGDSVAFCLSIAAGTPAFRESYEQWLDANMALTSYRRQLDAARRESIKNPCDWEKEQDVREVAVVKDAGFQVCLIRHGRKGSSFPARENNLRGFIPLLYGRAFSLDDSWCCRKGMWTAFGDRESIEAWESMPVFESELKPFSFLFKEGVSSIYGDKKHITLWNLNQ